jgi:hypothetical protein
MRAVRRRKAMIAIRRERTLEQCTCGRRLAESLEHAREVVAVNGDPGMILPQGPHVRRQRLFEQLARCGHVAKLM